MKFRLWILLFTVFLVYTFFVYRYGDAKGQKNLPPDLPVLKGWKIWQNKNCQSCHQLYGLGGYMGPDLTNVCSNPDKDEKYLKTLIRYGSGSMPNYKLNETEVDHLLSFLKWVDKSGRSKVTKEQVNVYGNYYFKESE